MGETVMKQIWAVGKRDEMNFTLVFTHKRTVKGGEVLRLASDTSFRVTGNGKLVGHGPRRMAHGFAAINEYDLDEFAGKEVSLCIECNSYRTDGFYLPNQQPFFAAEIISDGRAVATSLDFQAYEDNTRIQKVQRMSYQRGFLEVRDYTVKQSFTPVCVDEKEVCKLCEIQLPYPNFRVETAKCLGGGSALERTQYIRYDDSALNRNHTQQFEKKEQTCRITEDYDKMQFVADTVGGEEQLSANRYLDYQLPRLASGFISFDVEVTEPIRIVIGYDEVLAQAPQERRAMFQNGAPVINPFRYDKLSLASINLPVGTRNVCLFEPDAVQYIRLFAVGGKCKVQNVRLLCYENSEPCRTFSSEDKQLNLMYEAGVNTFRQNAVDVLTDCPSRERGGWFCDSYFTGRAEYHLTGNNLLEENLLRSILYRPHLDGIPDEVFPMVYPADMSITRSYIPNWCMWTILELWHYLKRRNGKKEFVAAFRARVCTFLDYILKFGNEDGLLENLESWVFVEWSMANYMTSGVNYPTNMLFSAALKAAYELYGVENYRVIAHRMDEQILSQSFNGEYFVDQAKRDENGKLVLNTEWTETCQYYAFYLGYASKRTHPELYRTIFERLTPENLKEICPQMHPANAFIGLYLRFDYLSSIGEHEKVIEGLKRYFYPQAQRTHTYWEMIDESASCCHAFASIACEWIDAWQYCKK